MPSYSSLLALIAPVFAIMGVGIFARHRGWLKLEAEESLLKVVVNVLFPCLIFKSVLGSRALLEPANLVFPLLVGGVTVLLGFAVGFFGGRLLGLSRGHGLRTFVFAVGIYNYGFIPIPLIDRMFGAETLSVLFVHNIGCELAIWTVGIVIVAGASWRDGWKRMINAPVVSIVVAAAVNFVGADRFVPQPLMSAFTALGACAVPLGLLVSGGSLFEFLREPRQLMNGRVAGASVLLRLGVIPLVFLAGARWLPLSIELKQIMIVEAAMPVGLMPIVLARHFGGQPLVAAQVILSTTLAALLVIPSWIRFGMMWVGL